MKEIYKGYFNFSRETFIERCYASSEKQARNLLLRRIAKRKGVNVGLVFGLFDGHKDNFKITKEIEFQEEADE